MSFGHVFIANIDKDADHNLITTLKLCHRHKRMTYRLYCQACISIQFSRTTSSSLKLAGITTIF